MLNQTQFAQAFEEVKSRIKVLETAGKSSTVTITLNDLDDVTITSVEDGQVLVFDGTSGEWINQEPEWLSLDGGTVRGPVTITAVAPTAALEWDTLLHLEGPNTLTDLYYHLKISRTGAYPVDYLTVRSDGTIVFGASLGFATGLGFFSNGSGAAIDFDQPGTGSIRLKTGSVGSSQQIRLVSSAGAVSEIKDADLDTSPVAMTLTHNSTADGSSITTEFGTQLIFAGEDQTGTESQPMARVRGCWSDPSINEGQLLIDIYYDGDWQNVMGFFRGQIYIPETVFFVKSCNHPITEADTQGTTQGTAFQITGEYFIATGGDVTYENGLKLPTSIYEGTQVTILNRTGFTINVYPSSGEDIEGLSTDDPLSVLDTDTIVFIRAFGPTWRYYTIPG